MKYLFITLISLLSLSSYAQTNTLTCVDFLPAPGQFVNVLPAYEEGDTKADMLDKCTEFINNGSLIHLGTYGGYVVFKFDHDVMNTKGSDLLINGNAFYSSADPYFSSTTIGGSIEPGIVYVGVGDSYETAKFYRLAGSQYYEGSQIGSDTTKILKFGSEIHDFSITYYKPTAESGDHEEFCSVYDKYIPWVCSWTDPLSGEVKDSIGYHIKNSFHKQTYWPSWIDEEELTFTGDWLPNNAIETSGKGTYWVQYRYSPNMYGYVDAAPSSGDTQSPATSGMNILNSFDIDWAIDDNGNPVHLTHINYVKVVCGIFQYCGWLGETSTELSSIKDLHLIDGYDDDPFMIDYYWKKSEITSVNKVDETTPHSDEVYDLTGRRVNNPSHGCYIKGSKLILIK